MAGLFQSFDFRASRYERPTQKWVCGWASQGKACHLGPDFKGNCIATAECRPHRSGDRWVCTRSDSAGGRCADGPLPDGVCARQIPKCMPVRGLRARRGLVTRVASSLTVGILLIFFFGPMAAKMISPGNRTQQHAEVLDCATCHVAFAGGPTGWIRAAFTAVPENPAAGDSGRCLKCHIRGDAAFNPHSLDTAVLKRMNPHKVSEQGTESLIVSLASVSGAGVAEMPKLPCATCHREHQGRDAKLASMSDDRCQACHSARFAGLNSGHPEFDRYPYKRRTRLIFDHSSHIGKHFKDEKFKLSAPGQCIGCHSPDAGGNTMEVNGYKTCAACHARQIVGDGDAIPLVVVPGIDAVTLQARGAPVGAWPEYAEAELTPFMILLMSGDPEFRKAWNQVRKLNLLDDLRDAGKPQIKAAQTVAWSVKGLIQDLYARGGNALSIRIEQVLGRKIDNEELARLAGRLPMDLIRNARQAWFPNLDDEMRRHRAGLAVETPGSGNAAPESKQPVADKPAPDTGDILSGGGKPAPDTGDILSGGGKAAPDTGDILSGGGTPAPDTGDILSGGGAPAPDTGDILSGGALPVTAAAEPAAEVEEIDPRKWTSAGGWYRDGFTLFYRPTGHADEYLRSWIDMTGAAGGEFVKPVFAALTAPQAAGRCAKCHSREALGNGALKTNWHAARPVKLLRKFTGFSHAAHSKLLNEKGCLSCHEPDDRSNYLAAFKKNDPAVFQSNFKPMERQTCARCHTPELAAESCVLCHQYHVGSFPPAIAAAPMSIQASGGQAHP